MRLIVLVGVLFVSYIAAVGWDGPNLISQITAKNCTAKDNVNIYSCSLLQLARGTDNCPIVAELAKGKSMFALRNEPVELSGRKWYKIGEEPPRWIEDSYQIKCHNWHTGFRGQYQVTAAQFSCMYPNIPTKEVRSFLNSLHWAIKQIRDEKGNATISGLKRVRMFMALTGYDTQNYTRFNEDPTDINCNNYDGGCRYRGRGALKLKHAYNYQRAKYELRADFVDQPELAGTPYYAFKIAAKVWNWTRLNICAENEDVATCTMLLTGGKDGLEERTELYKLAQKCIANVPGVWYWAVAGTESTFSEVHSTALSAGLIALIVVASLVAIAFVIVAVLLVSFDPRGKIVETVSY